MEAVALLGQSLFLGGAVWLAAFAIGRAISRPGALYSRALQGRSYRYAMLTGFALVVCGAVVMLAGWALSQT